MRLALLGVNEIPKEPAGALPEALVPQVQNIPDALEQMRQTVDLTDIEPAAVFHPEQG